jgi:hypothetical protein
MEGPVENSEQTRSLPGPRRQRPVVYEYRGTRQSRTASIATFASIPWRTVLLCGLAV